MRCRRFKKSGGQEAQALGRSRGGFSTEIHIAVDALGNPLRLVLTAGQRHDSPQAARLIEDYQPLALIADKGYNSDALIRSGHSQRHRGSDSTEKESPCAARVRPASLS